MPSSWDRLKELIAWTTVAAPATSSSSSSFRMRVGMCRPLARMTLSPRKLRAPGSTRPATRLTAMIPRPRANRPLRAWISSRASARTTRNLIGVRFFAASASSLDTGRFFEETWPPKRPARGEIAGGAAAASRSVIRPFAARARRLGGRARTGFPKVTTPRSQTLAARKIFGAARFGPARFGPARPTGRGPARHDEGWGASRLAGGLLGGSGAPDGSDRQRLVELERDHRAFGDHDLLAGGLGGDGGAHRGPHQGAEDRAAAAVAEDSAQQGAAGGGAAHRRPVTPPPPPAPLAEGGGHPPRRAGN